jgi:hypothetical protein
MTHLSRRTILQAGAGAAVAVPMTVLASRTAAAGAPTAGVPTGAGPSAGDLATTQPVMFCVHDAAAGEVSLLHGTSEVIVRDTALVSRILTAVAAVPSSRVVAATTMSA